MKQHNYTSTILAVVPYYRPSYKGRGADCQRGAAGYFAYRYFLRLGILDGKEGFIFHFLQAFWFRLVLDIRLDELLRSKISGTTADEGLDNKGRKCEP
jgi:hypothetical protein